MFSHCFKYTFLDFIRNKTIIFWVVLFPMILGTLFNFAFMNIYETSNRFSEIPVAVVDGCDNGGIKGLIESMEESGGMNLLSARFVSEDEALKLLEESEVDGIIYDDMLEPTLTIRSGGGMNASIIKVFLDRYKTNASVIVDIMESDPSKLPAVIEKMEAETDDHLELSNISSGNMNPFTAYFYNLLAMACLFVSMIGMFISINSQANLSSVGARVCLAPTSKAMQNVSGIIAAFVIFYTGIAIAAVYLVFVLGIDFGISFGEILFINLFGVFFGISLGFFVGSIGRMTYNTKTAILLACSLGTGFLSGLMDGSMPAKIEKSCPIINRINPSRLISDSFYAINSYGWGERLAMNIIKLSIMSVVLIICGCLITRKRQFKSL